MLTSNPFKYIVFPALTGFTAALVFGGWGILIGPAIVAGTLLYLDRDTIFTKETEESND